MYQCLREDGAGVNSLAGTVEVLIADAEGVVVAAVGVAETSEAVLGVGATAVGGLADVVLVVLAGVGGEGEGVRVGLPDVNLGAAGSAVADTGAVVSVRGLPAVVVGSAAEELEVTGALGVAVTGTVLGTGLVVGLAALATVRGHGDEVESRVQTALDGGQVDIEGELVAHQGEHLVLLFAAHEVGTGTDVGAVLVLGDKVQGEGIAAGGDTVGGAVVGTLDSAVLGAVVAAGADVGPGIAVVAVLETLDCFQVSHVQCTSIDYSIEEYLPPWVQRQLASMTTSPGCSVQEPEPVQVDQDMEG